MRILYIMHVPWGWIKQRPHFLAEELSKKYDLDVYAKKAFVKKNNVINKTDINVRCLYRLPGERYSLINYASNMIMGIQLRFLIKDYDCIWIPDPMMYYFFKDFVTDNKIVIFDCMDNYSAFLGIRRSIWLKKIYMEAEKQLVQRSNIIFCSSQQLAVQLIEKQECTQNKISVINNAISQNFLLHMNKVKHTKSVSGRKTIVYIGTISEWFDFNLLQESLTIYENIEYVLYGPCDVVVPSHERIIYKGILPHENILMEMKKADMLLMPFKITSLVLSVNPVKLYEYVSSNVPAVAAYYSELEIFSKYVYLYDDREEYFHILNLLVKGCLNPKSCVKDVELFLEKNTWEARAREICNVIEKY